MRRILLVFLLAAGLQPLKAQVPTQTVRGTVVEKETVFPLPGATVVLLNTNPRLATISDPKGRFKIDDVPVGRYNILVSFLGYEPYVIPEIMVGSAKEVIINAGLSESVVNMEAVVVKANVKKDQPLNTMATLSARMMNMDEAHRYAGGFDDPARLASSFAGVASGDMDDNSIVVRGNAPKGLQWRLEGVEIPNPNHFANMSTLGGGGITLFSSQMLTNSDFYTGAFPAEYGNVTAGVFDMKFRNGNNEQYEHAFQLGVLGLDFSSEGPLKKGGNASYLFNYRYSTFGLIKFVLPEDANVPTYQDLSFKFNLPTQKAGIFSFWGIGGLDAIDGFADKDSSLWKTFEDRKNMTGTIDIGATGINHKIHFGRNAYLENIVSASANQTNFEETYLDYDEVTEHPMQLVFDKNWRYTFSSKLNTKFNAQHTNRSGLIFSQIHYDSDLRASFSEGEDLSKLVDAKGSTELFQLFTQSRYKLFPGLTINTGAHLLYLTQNEEVSFEPRVGLSYKLPSSLTFSIGYGKHSQLESLGVYLAEIGEGDIKTQPNKNLRMSKSHHFIGGIDYSFNRYLRLKVEPYVQYLYDVPVISDSSYSTINMDKAWYLGAELTNEGTGINYGLDVTFERFLHKGYYYLITASLFDSKYIGGDGLKRNTMYNRNYIVNVLFGKEWKVKKNHILSVNGRMSFLGGNRQAPINFAASASAQEVVYDYSRLYERHDPNIFQLDMTITYKINKGKHSSSWALQVMNVLGRKEYYGYDYNYKEGKVLKDEVTVVVPSISYKIDF